MFLAVNYWVEIASHNSGGLESELEFLLAHSDNIDDESKNKPVLEGQDDICSLIAMQSPL